MHLLGGYMIWMFYNSHRMFYFLISLGVSNCDIMMLFNTLPRNVYYSSTFLYSVTYWIRLCAFGICLCWYVASLYMWLSVNENQLNLHLPVCEEMPFWKFNLRKSALPWYWPCLPSIILLSYLLAFAKLAW